MQIVYMSAHEKRDYSSTPRRTHLNRIGDETGPHPPGVAVDEG